MLMRQIQFLVVYLTKTQFWHNKYQMMEEIWFGREFLQCQPQQFSAVQNEGQECLFFYKDSFDSILVMAQKAVKKIHCWRLKRLRIVQLGAHGLNKNTVIFDGELIFTLWEKFNEIMGLEILLQIPNPSASLEKWCRAPLTNIYFVSKKCVSQKCVSQKKRDQIFMEVKSLLFQLNQVKQLFYLKDIMEHDSEAISESGKQEEREKPLKIIHIIKKINVPIAIQRQRYREEKQQEQIRKILRLFVIKLIKEIEEQEERNFFFKRRRKSIWQE